MHTACNAGACQLRDRARMTRSRAARRACRGRQQLIQPTELPEASQPATDPHATETQAAVPHLLVGRHAPGRASSPVASRDVILGDSANALAGQRRDATRHKESIRGGEECTITMSSSLVQATALGATGLFAGGGVSQPSDARLRLRARRV